jgi:hypothetical protein
MFPITLKDTGFEYGPISISYSSVTAAGIGVRSGGSRPTPHRTLLIGHRREGEEKPRLIRFGLKPGADGAALAAAFQAHVDSRWKGEDSYYAMRKTLGFRNNRIFTVVAAIVVLSFIITGVLVRNAMHLAAAQSSSSGAHSGRTH